MNAGQVRDTLFRPAGGGLVMGYDAKQVDDLLRRVAAELDAGGSARHLIQNATFPTPKYRRNYDIDAVDWFLDQFLLPDHGEPGGIADDPWGDLPVTQLAQGGPEKDSYAYQCQSAWDDFGQLPGTHLWFAKVAGGLTELRTADQQPLASVLGSRNQTFSASGRSFTLQRTSAADSSSPAVAEFRARAARDDVGHYEKVTRWGTFVTKVFFLTAPCVYALADETGTPILYTAGRNGDRRASACIGFPDQRWLRFLVRGTYRGNAIMSAVDQARNRIARYRLTDKSGRQREYWRRASVEIIVHPGRKLTDELALTLALSAGWLGSYFDQSGGGG